MLPILIAEFSGAPFSSMAPLTWPKREAGGFRGEDSTADDNLSFHRWAFGICVGVLSTFMECGRDRRVPCSPGDPEAAGGLMRGGSSRPP